MSYLVNVICTVYVCVLYYNYIFVYLNNAVLLSSAGACADCVYQAHIVSPSILVAGVHGDGRVILVSNKLQLNYSYYVFSVYLFPALLQVSDNGDIVKSVRRLSVY